MTAAWGYTASRRTLRSKPCDQPNLGHVTKMESTTRNLSRTPDPIERRMIYTSHGGKLLSDKINSCWNVSFGICGRQLVLIFGQPCKSCAFKVIPSIAPVAANPFPCFSIKVCCAALRTVVSFLVAVVRWLNCLSCFLCLWCLLFLVFVSSLCSLHLFQILQHLYHFIICQSLSLSVQLQPFPFSLWLNTSDFSYHFLLSVRTHRHITYNTLT